VAHQDTGGRLGIFDSEGNVVAAATQLLGEAEQGQDMAKVSAELPYQQDLPHAPSPESLRYSRYVRRRIEREF
jgi:hypothetical protein